MASIIAHPGRGFRLPLRAMGRWLLSRVGCECPLCGARVAGARLCAGCEADICETDREPGIHETDIRDADIRGAAIRGATLDAPSIARQQALSRCPRCALRLRPGAPHCASCLGTPRAFSRTVAAFDYAPPADTLILMLKTRLRLSMAPVLARLIAAAVGRDGPLADGALLVAIPASRASLRQRGMNPAAEIARSLAAELGLPLARGLLRRRRETTRQTAQGRRARRLGAQNLFYCAGEVRGRHLVVVDDVMTTGSTANAAAAALVAAGAASVTVLVAARTP
ncbi:ComF family protein [Achromobacter xylosoxidans]|nr:phosphoribosyltransferase family protein [Achromobacter xylosoxidans]